MTLRNFTSAALAITCAAASVLVSAPVAAAAATFVVNRIGDSSDLNPGNGKCDVSTNAGQQCTLRAAIQEANALAGADTINFNITSASTTIAPASQLPKVTKAVTINGYSQAGASPNTLAVGNDAVLKIILDGVNAGAAATGLRVTGDNVIVRGLAIQRWDGSGISISGVAGLVAGNLIGTNPAGTVARPNRIGVSISGSEHILGGSTAAARNLISANLENGVRVDGADLVTIQGNYIGTTKDGSTDLGNKMVGISFANSSRLTIGGSAAETRNVVSGNDRTAIACENSTMSKIVGNRIGTDASGMAGIEVGQDGVSLLNCGAITIGEAVAGGGNTISSSQVGITLNLSDNNVVVGNRVGMRSDGTGNLGNRFGGIAVSGSNNLIGGAGAKGNVVANTKNAQPGISIAGDSASGNVIQGNAITGNTGAGVDVWRQDNRILGNSIVGNGEDGIRLNRFVGVGTPTGVKISGNVLIGNGQLGIDLSSVAEDSFGVTPNDPGDADVGANRQQNYPVLTSAVRLTNGITVVQGTLNSTASTVYRIELFLAAADASGHGEAQAFLTTQNITMGLTTNKAFTFQVAGLSPGLQLTTTAINTQNNDTSELSNNVAVVPGPG